MSITEAITAEQRENADAQIREELKNIRYSTIEYPIETVVDKFTSGLDDGTNEIFIPSNYHREIPWDANRQSKFI